MSNKGQLWQNMKIRVSIKAIETPSEENKKNAQLLREILSHPLVEMFRMGGLCEECRARTADSVALARTCVIDKAVLQEMLDHMRSIARNGLRNL